MRTRISTLPLVALLALAGLPGSDDSARTLQAAPTAGLAATAEALPSPLGPGSVEQAEISSFFCFFVVFNNDTGDVSGYSGESRVLTTPGGPIEYRCQADLLFGPGLDTAATFTRVGFSSFELGYIETCTVRVNPAGWGFANCNVKD